MINQLTGFKGSYVKVKTSHGLSVTDIQLNVRQISHYLNFQQVSNNNENNADYENVALKRVHSLYQSLLLPSFLVLHIFFSFLCFLLCI